MNNKKNNPKRIVYLDNASATKLDKNVLNKIFSVFKKDYVNPSALYDLGLDLNIQIKEIKKHILNLFKSEIGEIIFTSGATESNNLAILGFLNALPKKKNFLPHIIISNIEHSSILELCKKLENDKKIELTLLPVEENGILNSNLLRKNLKENTVLVSVMYVNNEIGTIQPLKEITKEIRHYRKHNETIFPILHSDITQALNYLEINFGTLGIDMASFNSAKIYGPKGIGILYKRKNLKLNPIIIGGNQESGLRAGTENFPLIIGLYESVLATLKIRDKEVKRLVPLQKYFIQKLKKVFEKYKIKFTLNGDLEKRIPNNINITISNIPSDLILIELANYGIYISEKSACKSGEKKNSYVIEALNKDTNSTFNSLRFSLGRETTKEDLNYVISILDKVLKKLHKWYN